MGYSKRTSWCFSLSLAIGLIAGGATLHAQSLEFTTVATGATGSGIASHSPTDSVVASVNQSTGSPINLRQFFADGTSAPYSTLAGITGEVKLGSIGPAGLGGFTPGDIFLGSNVPGEIIRVTNGGATVFAPWTTFPSTATNFFNGSIVQDTTGQFGNQLIFATTAGEIWLVASDGTTSATPFASLGTYVEGLAVLPNDPAQYGPLAGRLLAGSHTSPFLYGVDTAGGVISLNVGISMEDVDIVPANGNFFGISADADTIVGVRKEQWAPYVGDIILTREHPAFGTSGLYRLTWDGTAFSLATITMAAGSPSVTQWEHVTFSQFAPATLCPEDTDLDGTPDCIDLCPNDPNKVEPGFCGCGVTELDTDGDGTCDDLDSDDDNDGVPDTSDSAPLDPFVCQDLDGDGCDDCASGTVDPANDGNDFDGDGLCDSGDIDDDNDGVADGGDSAPLDPFQCTDSDADGCDDCASGTFDPANDGTDTDGDGLCDVGDTDDDNDGVGDGSDSDPLDPFVCGDSDGDGCDDCSSGTFDPANDGLDTDADGLCDAGDSDDDNDTVPDGSDSAPLNPFQCQDLDADGCDDCELLGLANPANDGTDTDGDGLCDLGDPDDDNDSILDGSDPAPLDPFICGDSDGDGCDDCAVLGASDPANDGTDTDGDGLCDLGDPDDDNDSILDGSDPAPLDPFICGDSDGDGCDDCAVLGASDPANDGTDTDGDGLCDLGDPDDDNDSILDGSDPAPLDPFICGDSDADGCDDCAVLGASDPANDGTDTDGDGLCDLGDPDDDNDSILDGSDPAPLDPFICGDSDADGCDDCAVLGASDPANDGTDTDGDGLCDLGDPDDDNDGVADSSDDNPLDPFICQDLDADGCDDCASGTVNPANDGLDTDGDGLCDLGDPDDDNDGVNDGSDGAPLDPFQCQDLDGDGCDDCASGTVNPANDGLDTDGDGLCDLGDPDDDNDGVLDGNDSNPLDPFQCQDLDADGCDDCASGTVDPANDGLDTDGDGLCDAGDADDDNDGVEDGSDSAPLDPFQCQDLDADGCDDCASGTVDAANDGTDTDGDGLCDLGDSDDDNDGVDDTSDDNPLDPFVCQDLDADGCDDCASGTVNPANDGTDTDGDGICDLGDTDDDNDGVDDGDDSAPLDPFQCQDLDADGCDDCSSGTVNPANDGTDTDGDGICDLGDTDDDNDGVDDGDDSDPLDPLVCQDLDADGCDDCASGTVNPANDGTDTDGDGICDLGDTDDDNDGVDDTSDDNPLDPFVCQDLDADGCDDCASGTVNPANDGTDTDGDGICDLGDTDDDNDGVDDGDDSDPLDPFVCQDLDADGCDDCASGTVNPANDGTDTDGDGLCDLGDTDDDNDGVDDGDDSAPLDPFQCQDLDGDGCDDCSSGTVDAANDGLDTDADGICDAGDGCPDDPAKSSPGICGCGAIDDPTDTDLDGTPDCADLCPIDPNKTDPGDCGCGFEDTDIDMNGITDCLEDLPFVRSDANVDGNIDISDSVYLLNYLFQEGPAPICLNAGDANDDAAIDLSDAIYTITYIFNGGAPPPAPFPDCGADGTPLNSIGCEVFPPCE